MLDSDKEKARVQEFQDKIVSLSKYGPDSYYEIYWILMDMMQLKVEKNIENILENCKKYKKIDTALIRISTDVVLSPLKNAVEKNNVAMINQLLKIGLLKIKLKIVHPVQF